MLQQRALPAILVWGLILALAFFALPQSSKASGKVERDAQMASNGERNAPAIPLPPRLKGNKASSVRSVLDGDTVRLANGRTVRIACVDAPDLEEGATDRTPADSKKDERERSFRSEESNGSLEQSMKVHFLRYGSQYFSKESKDALKKEARGKRVRLLATKKKTDSQGRLVADLQLDNGSTLSCFLLENGLAYYVYDPDFPKSYQKQLIRLQAKAINARRGFWGLVLNMRTTKTYIGSQENKLFYSYRDVKAQKIRPRKRAYFGTLLDAFIAGYAPANSMEFWPPEKIAPRKKSKRAATGSE